MLSPSKASLRVDPWRFAQTLLDGTEDTHVHQAARGKCGSPWLCVLLGLCPPPRIKALKGSAVKRPQEGVRRPSCGLEKLHRQRETRVEKEGGGRSMFTSPVLAHLGMIVACPEGGSCPLHPCCPWYDPAPGENQLECVGASINGVSGRGVGEEASLTHRTPETCPMRFEIRLFFCISGF